MIINPMSAINGIGGMLGTANPAAGAAVGAAGPALGSFAEMVGNAATNTIAGMRDAEKVSIDAVQGKAETREVVDAIMSAEQSLQAAISIRDKIVTAYLEVSRMAI